VDVGLYIEERERERERKRKSERGIYGS